MDMNGIPSGEAVFEADYTGSHIIEMHCLGAVLIFAFYPDF
jgi:hypothetical protein